MRQALLTYLTLFILIACNQITKTSDNSIEVTEGNMDTTKKITSQTMKRKSLLPDSLTKITGDFNGDGERDSAVAIPPYQDENGLCEQCITLKPCLAFRGHGGLNAIRIPVRM